MLVGALCMFLGYRLLMRGIYSGSNERAVWDDNFLLLKRGAPGILFALFGALIIIVSLFQAGEVRRREAPAPVEQTQTQPAENRKQLSSAPERNGNQERNAKDLRPEQPKPRVAPQQAAKPAEERKATRKEKAAPGEDPPTRIAKPSRA